jgi:MFS transporter, DHA2 family, multidrug resistance protein
MESERAAINPWIVAVAVMLSTFMEVLDTTVVNVSLPHIAGSLSATVEESTWALTSYLVANAIVLPLTGWLANYFGRKRLLTMSTVGFAAASFLCGFSPTLPLLIVFRIIQGACGGGLQPLSQAVLLEAFPPEKRGKAMGFWGLGIVVAPMLGPVLGGWLTDSYSWRWVFYINIPIGIASVIMTQLFIFDPPYIKRSTSKIDTWGIGLLAVGVGALQIALDKGQQEDWFNSNWIITLSIITVVGFTAFIIRELTTEHPVVNLGILRDRNFSMGVFLITVVGFVLYASLVLLPIFLQTLLGYPALQAGIAMAPRGFGSFLAMPLVGILVARTDPRKLLTAGLAMAAFTLYWLSQLNLDAGYWNIAWPQLLQGLSLGLLFVPLTTATMSSVPVQEMGNATSIFNLMRNIGGSIGIASVTTMLARRQQMHISRLGEAVNPYNQQAQQILEALQKSMMARGSDMVTAMQRSYASVYGMVLRQAELLSFNEAFRVLAIMFLLLLPLVWFMKRPRGKVEVVAH